MGVRGLTTFIHSNPEVFFTKFNLHGCTLIVDGNSLAAVLYCEMLGPYSAFGGDYDLFAKHAEDFILNLKKCEVEVIFVFDGGYEQKKAVTVKKRNAKKVYAIDKVTPNKPSRDFFPLMMRPVLQERLIELGVTCLQSDYEADGEIAAIAKRLNAPVLSNDSDFFIFGLPFIPLSTFPLNVCHSESKTSGVSYYVPCQIFYVENLLKSFGTLEQTMLPLLATVLGNDYVKRSIFKNFYSLIKLDKGKKFTLGQRRVKGLVRWLKNETFDSALKKILASLPKNHRRRVRADISSIIKGYSNISTCLSKYLPVINNKKISDNYEIICAQLKEINISEYNDSSNEDSNEDDDEEDLDTSESSFQEAVEEDDSNEVDDIDRSATPPFSTTCHSEIPQWFLEQSRVCQAAPQILTLLSLNTYYCIPQIEDCSLPHAGEIGLPILKIISGLIFGSTSFTYWYRHGSDHYWRKKVESIDTIKNCKLPEFSELYKTSFEVRRDILLDTMKVENKEFLDLFPEEWRLLIVCLVYWIKSESSLTSYHVHAVVLMIIAVNICQSKVGFFRKSKLFVRKYGAKVKSLGKIREKYSAKFDENKNLNVIEEFSKITIDDCLIFYETILCDFNVDPALKERPRNFNRNIIHFFAELQTVLELGQTLNSLLLHPYKRMKISKFYNGTFLYNSAFKLKYQPDIITYLEKLFKKSPNLLHLHMSLYCSLAQFATVTLNMPRKLRSKRHKKRPKKLAVNSLVLEDLSEISDSFYDENNKFSLLQERT